MPNRLHFNQISSDITLIVVGLPAVVAPRPCILVVGNAFHNLYPFSIETMYLNTSMHRTALVSLNSTVYFVTLMSWCLLRLNENKTPFLKGKKTKGTEKKSKEKKSIVVIEYLGSDFQSAFENGLLMIIVFGCIFILAMHSSPHAPGFTGKVPGSLNSQQHSLQSFL